MKVSLETQLRQGADEMGLSLTDVQVHHLLAYQALIEKWTKIYNLTALRSPEDILTHHVQDSLAVIKPLEHQLEQAGINSTPLRLLDAGSGAGLPGVVIAICCPHITVHGVDSVAKKAAFIQQVAITLKLPNLAGLHARVEHLTDTYHVITSRAFASLPDLTTLTLAALAENGIWMAMKGQHPTDELAALPGSIHVFHTETLQVPGLKANRCLIWMKP